ncbi:hypothetical protein H4582DRAFT_2059520 [Lactarius indigo]|nr:hypothetical protein H4582DRAFT_2059520 [Lactarius indigo]
MENHQNLDYYQIVFIKSEGELDGRNFSCADRPSTYDEDSICMMEAPQRLGEQVLKYDTHGAHRLLVAKQAPVAPESTAMVGTHRRSTLPNQSEAKWRRGKGMRMQYAGGGGLLGRASTSAPTTAMRLPHAALSPPLPSHHTSIRYTPHPFSFSAEKTEWLPKSRAPAREGSRGTVRQRKQIRSCGK